MSEYWVSKKKYFCKYCDIYIADDAPSRQQHENGMRHKGSVERFIRGIYKAGEKQKKDLEEEKREMKRVEQAAAAAFAHDVGAGLAKATGPVASTSTVAPRPTAKPSNPFANYSTAQSLGYIDPDAERIAAELEQRRSEGVAGEWQIITPPQLPAGSSSTPVPGSSDPDSTDGPSEAGIKREAEAPIDEDDTRAFKLRKKTIASGLGEIYDPGAIPIKIKKKPEPEETNAGPSAAVKPEPADRPKWTPTQWKRPGDIPKETLPESDSVKLEEGTTHAESTSSGPSKWVKPQWSQPLPDLKQEERQSIFGVEEPPPTEPNSAVKAEPDVKPEVLQTPTTDAPSSSGSFFKKRKTPAGANRGRRDL
ncbi:hypothetical protein HYPSUDRAFT_34958 [Hypholoma sublateritium FD-334 SS-4]|uniref:Matrin-type domain-containing protein n=1 Tax=Hypholoma sublateritium (strain FD-334 SS-4) TaxID=945553 RepID=A0A0D2Q7W3_HYPSF|nr:hypothetical protein HYPSUDRAFT_34958 [Hypholoma sublateritium FD-334 SS-4]